MTHGTETPTQLDALTLALRNIHPVLTRIMALVESADSATPEMAQLGRQLGRIAAALEAQAPQVKDLRETISQMTKTAAETQGQLDVLSEYLNHDAQSRARLEKKIDSLLRVLVGPA